MIANQVFECGTCDEIILVGHHTFPVNGVMVCEECYRDRRL